MTLDAPRRSYGRAHLDESDLDPDPLRQLRSWLEDALATDFYEPNAMTLATADASGRVSARMVLLKGVEGGGLEFYTNYGSRKGRDLAVNPRAAAVLYWDRLERQARAEGRVVRLSVEASRAYFATRPYGSQIAAWASEQSRPLADRAALEERFAAFEARFPPGEVPLPPGWGGYRLLPERLEFWQGRENRLHDRIVYRAAESGWTRERLFP